MLNYSALNISPDLHDALAETCYRILNIGIAEMKGLSTLGQVHGFANDLPHLLLSYGFTTVEELTLPSLLDHEAYSMLKLISDVKAFHNAGAGPVVDKPTPLPEDRIELRNDLLPSETDEAVEAVAANNLAKILQENLDVIYVAVGTLIEAGLGEAAIVGWQELQDSNMRKVNVETGMLVKREDGKILKPEGWKGVDWEAIVERFTYQYDSRYKITGLYNEVITVIGRFNGYVTGMQHFHHVGDVEGYSIVEVMGPPHIHKSFVEYEGVEIYEG